MTGASGLNFLEFIGYEASPAPFCGCKHCDGLILLSGSGSFKGVISGTVQQMCTRLQFSGTGSIVQRFTAILTLSPILLWAVGVRLPGEGNALPPQLSSRSSYTTDASLQRPRAYVVLLRISSVSNDTPCARMINPS